jgi:hypothetical protein
MGGDMWVKSAEGLGSTFSFYILGIHVANNDIMVCTHACVYVCVYAYACENICMSIFLSLTHTLTHLDAREQAPVPLRRGRCQENNRNQVQNTGFHAPSAHFDRRRQCGEPESREETDGGQDGLHSRPGDKRPRGERAVWNMNECVCNAVWCSGVMQMRIHMQTDPPLRPGLGMHAQEGLRRDSDGCAHARDEWNRRHQRNQKILRQG